jgi:hypothetical protein
VSTSETAQESPILRYGTAYMDSCVHHGLLSVHRARGSYYLSLSQDEQSSKYEVLLDAEGVLAQLYVGPVKVNGVFLNGVQAQECELRNEAR